GLLTDAQPFRNLLVAQASPHVGDDLALALGQRVLRARAGCARAERVFECLGGQPAVRPDLAARDRADRAEEGRVLALRREDSGRAGAQRALERVIGRLRREQQDARSRVRGTKLPDEMLRGVAPHLPLEEKDAWIPPRDDFLERLALGDAPDELELGFLVEPKHEELAQ